ncbi:MAG: isoprenyl transferase [Prochlorococcus sp. SP3034]|nr:isoprenyl transferase [Prochlorococcus sp. SP3034]|tara:strand:+ start:13908 stop:14738 length:831 start_codon:yes stop_codon:yes gene_type:complete
MSIQKINMKLKNTTNVILDLTKEIDKLRIPQHIAIIMDGNGRWGTKRGLPRSHGHNKGVMVLKNIIKLSKNLGIKVLTVYAFSTENWSRPYEEVNFLLNLFDKVLKKELEEINKESIRLRFIGDLSPFPENLKQIINESEEITQNNRELTLNVCMNYGGRQELVRAAKELSKKSLTGEISPDQINEKLFASELFTKDFNDPELLIRTSGERRISNFLLWQLAYSEIYITEVLWPEFNDTEFLKAIIDYQSRNRRFGGIESISKESIKALSIRDNLQ